VPRSPHPASVLARRKRRLGKKTRADDSAQSRVVAALAMKRVPVAEFPDYRQRRLKRGPVADKQLLAIIHKLQNGLALAVVEYALRNCANLIGAATKFGQLFFVSQLGGPPWELATIGAGAGPSLCKKEHLV
jgi:hypothetical protein